MGQKLGQRKAPRYKVMSSLGITIIIGVVLLVRGGGATKQNAMTRYHLYLDHVVVVVDIELLMMIITN